MDPGDAAPAEAALADLGLTLLAVLLTHHHPDHVGGAAELAASHQAPVYGPPRTACGADFRPLHGGERIVLQDPPIAFSVLPVPGHTRDHLAYFGEGALFCGDTLFAGGCGRLFEGTPAEMFASLEMLAGLPDETLVYCAHEYTLANLRFARAADPHNPAIAAREHEAIRQRELGQPTLPSTIALERATNPFLRCRDAGVRQVARERAGRALATPIEVFTVLRAWKDIFRA